MLDIGGGGHHGIIHGARWQVIDDVPCLYFNGESNYAETPNLPHLAFGSGADRTAGVNTYRASCAVCITQILMTATDQDAELALPWAQASMYPSRCAAVSLQGNRDYAQATPIRQLTPKSWDPSGDSD